jgi:predicted dehydrogenase
VKKIKVLIVGCGHMGASHARAYNKIDDFEIVGVVSRGSESRGKLARELGIKAQFDDYNEALAVTRPDAVSINTYPGTHCEYAIKAMEAGAHVFLEKPIGTTVEEAEKVVAAAKNTGRKLVVGYILRHHPSWIKFIEVARTLGKPLVMRMNLNQQSRGSEWETHKNLINALPPIVDCGVHYVDVMCQMTRSKPVRVQAIGARLSEEIEPGSYNYGQLQVIFEDRSVGWYEAGWGPMMSEQAYFVKDVIGPKGCVSIVNNKDAASDDVDAHTRTNSLLVHSGKLNLQNQFINPDKTLSMEDEPLHQDLCDREQLFFLKAIREDADLADHLDDAVNSLRIVLAADESVRTGKSVEL